MSYRVMLRERNKPDWTLHNGPFETYEDAEREAIATVTNSGFDAFQVWQLMGQQELQPQFISTYGAKS